MATLSVTIPDAALDRILLAFGRPKPAGARIPATQAELEDALMNFVRSTLANYEGNLAGATTAAAVAKEWIGLEKVPPSQAPNRRRPRRLPDPGRQVSRQTGTIDGAGHRLHRLD